MERVGRTTAVVLSIAIFGLLIGAGYSLASVSTSVATCEQPTTPATDQYGEKDCDTTSISATTPNVATTTVQTTPTEPTSDDDLPNTGLSLLTVVAVALALVIVGLALRRRGR